MSEETGIDAPVEESAPAIEESSSTEDGGEATPVDGGEGMTQQEAQVIRELALKVDGEDIIEQLPFDLPEEHAEYLKQQIQLAKVAQKRMQETASEKKQRLAVEGEVREFLTALREDPESVLSDPNLKVDLKALAERIMEKELKEAEKSPAQKEKEAYEKRIKELEDAKLKAEKESKTKELKAEEAKIAHELQSELISAMESGGLPKNDPDVLSMMAKNMRVALKFGIPVTARELVPIIKKEIYEKMKKQLGMLKDEELAAFIGKDRMGRITKSLVKTAKRESPADTAKIRDSGKKEQEAANAAYSSPKRTMKQRDFFKELSKNPSKFINK